MKQAPPSLLHCGALGAAGAGTAAWPGSDLGKWSHLSSHSPSPCPSPLCCGSRNLTLQVLLGAVLRLPGFWLLVGYYSWGNSSEWDAMLVYLAVFSATASGNHPKLSAATATGIGTVWLLSNFLVLTTLKVL